MGDIIAANSPDRQRQPSWGCPVWLGVALQFGAVPRPSLYQ